MTGRSTTAGMPVRLCSSIRFLAVATIAALSVSSAALAHHSFAMFDANKTLSTTATVKEFQWASPHTWLELIVLDADETENAEAGRQSNGHLSSNAGWHAGRAAGASSDRRRADPEGAVAACGYFAQIRERIEAVRLRLSCRSPCAHPTDAVSVQSHAARLHNPRVIAHRYLVCDARGVARLDSHSLQSTHS
jgi:Family of unknown function (DUF6152)